MIERFQRPSFGQLNIEITINNPTDYTKPWTATAIAGLTPDAQLLGAAAICNENEKSTQHVARASK